MGYMIYGVYIIVYCTHTCIMVDLRKVEKHGETQRLFPGMEPATVARRGRAAQILLQHYQQGSITSSSRQHSEVLGISRTFCCRIHCTDLHSILVFICLKTAWSEHSRAQMLKICLWHHFGSRKECFDPCHLISSHAANDREHCELLNDRGAIL